MNSVNPRVGPLINAPHPTLYDWVDSTLPPVLRPTTIPYSKQCQPWSGPSYQCTPPYSVRLSGLHPTPCATPYNYSLQRTVSTMEWALLSMHSTLLCIRLSGLHPTPCATPYNYSLQWTLSTMEWALLSMHSTLLCIRLSGLHPTPCATPYNYSLQWTLSTMEWALINALYPTLYTIEWTPPYPLCYALQLFLTVNSVNHGVGPLINALYPTLYNWVESPLPPVLRPTTIPYSKQCQPWSGPSYQCTPPYSVRLSGLHPTPCATPYNYSLQWTVSTMEWAFFLMHSILPCTIEWTPPYPLCYAVQLFLTEITLWKDSILQCTFTIEWTPPYPLCYALQLFLTANSVNHGVGPLINALHLTQYDWVDSTLPPVLHPTTIPYSELCQPWSGPSYQCTLPYSVRLSGLHPTPCATPYNYSLQWTVSTMEWAFLLMHSILPCTIEWTPPYPLCYAVQLFLTEITLWKDSILQCTFTIEWTPPYPLCYALQLFLTANSVNHGVGPLINALYPTLNTIEWTPPYPLCYALQPTIPYSKQCQQWNGPSYQCTLPYSVRLSELHPTPCATPYNYSLQWTVSTMEWALLLMHSTLLSTIERTPPYPLCYALQLFLTVNSVNHGVALLLMHSILPCTIEWTPPYPLCYALQLFLTVNSVNHGVGPLINALYPTQYDWVDSTLPLCYALQPTFPYSKQCQQWSGPSYQCTPPYSVRLSGLLHPTPCATPYNYSLQWTVSTMEWALLLIHPTLLCTIEWTPPSTPCATPYNYSLQWTVSTMEWALLLMHSTLLCTIEWTPPYPLCYAVKLFLTEITLWKDSILQCTFTIEWTPPSTPCATPYNYSLQQTVSTMEWALINALHPTQYDWVDSTLPPCATPYNYSLQRTVSTMEWALLSMHSTLLCIRLSGLHPTPCATPYNYSLQWTLSTMEWALLLMHSTLLCTIEWSPPYPLCYALQLFLTVNSVNHGVGPLINALYPTLYNWVESTLPPVLRPTTIPYSKQCQQWSGLLINALHPTLYDWVDSTLSTTIFSLVQAGKGVWSYMYTCSRMARVKWFCLAWYDIYCTE